MQLAFSAGYTDNAQVVSIEDVYREHTIKQPYQDCYTKEFRQRVSGDGSATNEIFGSILGGAIGNQFGGGSGKKVMTVAGALLGASIANDNERVGYKVVNKQICDTKYHYRSEKRFSHYLVTYLPLLACFSLRGTKLILATNLITQNCTKGTVWLLQLRSVANL
jgi:uncharacterized protein YcfJ